MGKINKMASHEERVDLSEKILSVKNKLNVTFKGLNRTLSRPCSPSTLQIRAAFPKKPCSQKLRLTIIDAISKLESSEVGLIDDQIELKRFRDSAIQELTKTFDDEIRKIEEYFKNKYSRPAS